MKIRAIINGVSFYTTTAQIRKGIGDFSSQNIAVRQVYDQMIKERVLGFGTTITLYDYKMQKEKFQIQLTKC